MLRLNRTTLIIICAVIWVLAGFTYPKTPYPHFEAYRGETEFDGTRAYELLEELVTDYPGRIVGSEAARRSAEWVAEQLSALGVQVRTEEFATRAPLQLLAPRPVVQYTRFEPGTISDLTGVNVIGVLPGESTDAILIGAHRDVAGTLQGAEDDGSGTAVMLEMARVLAQSPRKNTYVFASFDAEETGLFGSRDFARNLPDDSIKLAICLDMVGQQDAEFVTEYNTIAGGKRTALWSYAFLRQFIYEEQGRKNLSLEGQHLHQALWDQTLQGTSTDSGSFIAEGIPGIGLRVGSSRRDFKVAPIHTTADTLENVSAEMLGKSGSLVERMVLTLEVQGIPEEHDTNYAPATDSYGSGAYVRFFQILVALLMLIVLAYDWLTAFKQIERPMALLKRELVWLLVVVPVAAGVSGYLLWLSRSGRMGFPFGSEMLPIALVPLFTLVLLRVFRRKQTRPGNRAANQLVYCSLLLVMMLAGSLLFGWPKAMFALLVPVVFGTHWAAIPLILSATTTYRLAMSSLAYDLLSGVSLSSAAFLAWAVTLWLSIGIYGLQSTDWKQLASSSASATPPSRT